MRRQWSYSNNLTFHLNDMAKLSMIERERKRDKLNKKYFSKIKMIKEKLKDSKTSNDEALQLRLKIKDSIECTYC